MVAVLGVIFPCNDKIGSVVILENDGKNHFKKHVVIDKVARVSDVRAGDIDGDVYSIQTETHLIICPQKASTGMVWNGLKIQEI